MSSSTDHQQGNHILQPSYIMDGTTSLNGTNETLPLCDIKIICIQKKKRTKRHIYLTFVESCPLSSSNEQPCIEIIGKTNGSSILLNECISYEYFDTIKNDFQSFIYIYFENYTISIHFSDEHIHKKPLIIKHFEYMYKKNNEQSNEINKQQISQELPCLSITENILHTFDIKLIPYGTIISHNHILIGHARLYFTTTDLYISSIDCNQIDLKTTITNQCPSKDKPILCIPYFTIKHYGNRSNIFLIELGKSNYGNGEIHMKCLSSSLASTIHLLASPVIEERPLILSSAFQNQLLTHKRMEKSKNIHPPIQLNHDTVNSSIADRSLPFSKELSIERLSENSTKSNQVKSRSLFSWVRKLVKNTTQLQRSYQFDSNQNHLNQQSKILSSSMNKFFELNIEEKRISHDQQQNILPKSQSTIDSLELIKNKTNKISVISSSNKQETTNGTYIDMGPTISKIDSDQQEEIHDEKKIIKEITTSTDIGINTTISLPPHVHSAIIVGNSVHLIAEERAVFPIGQRSFTSPASVMQPFKAQLHGQTINNNYTTETNLTSCVPNNSSSIHQPTSNSNSQQSLFLSYGIVTLNKIPLTSDQPERPSSPLSDISSIDRRLNSDLSLMSISHQQQASNIYSYDNILSSSSSSHIFRTLSLSTNNIGDNTSGQICTSNGSIIFFDDNLTDQATTYLLGSPPIPLTDEQIQTNLSRVSSFNLPTSISRTHLSNINEEKLSTNDSYAFIEPLSINDNSLPNLLTILTKPLLISEKTINYTDLLLPSSNNNNNNDDEQQNINSSDQNNDQSNNINEEKTERSSTVIYTGIDFHQIERRDRIAQLAATSHSEDKTPPFVL
ncbi:unnamed protein product [Rotaria sordida]|uniref:Uncharacterized protein n=1 Tax=Rotaria sordida TaxID=392033 RepID=A0A818TGH9_9BILA|nr:unnamed protein product [Rotaria sordida]CAF3677278.1 unnamed protein product [Rotaria sordida]